MDLHYLLGFAINYTKILKWMTTVSYIWSKYIYWNNLMRKYLKFLEMWTIS